MDNPLIEVHLNTSIKSIDGYVGKYSTILESSSEEKEIKHGVIIVATGAKERKPSEYLYGTDNRVITQMELEGQLKTGELDNKDVRNIVMIQCVGSRDEERPYCSRVCCNQAIKNALVLKERNKQANITILYRDIRAYSFNEANYKTARRAGIQFIRYEPERKPIVVADRNELTVKVYEQLIGEELILKTDLLVLSSAIIPETGHNRTIAQMLKVPLNQEGFFLEAHAKLRPVDFATEGVYLCGLAHAPKNLRESMVQGKAAASRAVTVISKDTLETEGTIAQVDENLCAGCGACEEVCAYKAVSVQEIEKRHGKVKKAVVNAVLCKGCGTCSATCRCGAIDVNGFSDRQIIAEIESLIKG